MTLRRGYAVLFLIFVTLGIYYPSIFAEANSVDDIQIINAFLDVERFDLKSLFSPGGYYYRPIVGLTFIFDSIFWEMHESFMHLENILIHAINTVLVYFITEKVAKHCSIKSSLLPLCSALLFAVHPINTESVNWIAGRTDLLSGFFILLSILLLLHSLERDSQLLGAAGVAVFFLACMSKEVAVSALPGLLAIVLFWDRDGSLSDKLRKRWACSGSLIFTVILFFSLLLRFFLLNKGDNGGKILAATVNSPGFELLNTFRLTLTALGFYAKKLFIPWPLNFAIVQISAYYVLAGIVVLVAIGYLLLKRGVVQAFFLTSICLVSPALLVSVARMTWTPLAERYLYVSCALFCIASTVALYKFLFQEKSAVKKLSQFSLLVLLTVLTYSTVNRNIIWQNNVTLFKDTLQNSPDFYLVQNALAFSLRQKEKFDESRALLTSIKAPEGSKRGGKLIDSNQAMTLAAKGDFYGAKKLLLRNIENSGIMYHTILENLIIVDLNLLGQEKKREKIKELQEEIAGYLHKLHEMSGDPFYYYRLGQFYLGIGNKSEAQIYFAKASVLSKEGAHYKQAAKKLAVTLN